MLHGVGIVLFNHSRINIWPGHFSSGSGGSAPAFYSFSNPPNLPISECNKLPEEHSCNTTTITKTYWPSAGTMITILTRDAKEP
jgi:hypothetical protein